MTERNERIIHSWLQGDELKHGSRRRKLRPLGTTVNISVIERDSVL